MKLIPWLALVFQHPAVSECCVLGLPDKTYGEVVCAIIVPPEENKRKQELELKPALTLEEICSWAKDKLAPYKVLRLCVVVFVMVHVIFELSSPSPISSLHVSVPPPCCYQDETHWYDLQLHYLVTSSSVYIGFFGIILLCSSFVSYWSQEILLKLAFIIFACIWSYRLNYIFGKVCLVMLWER